MNCVTTESVVSSPGMLVSPDTTSLFCVLVTGAVSLLLSFLFSVGGLLSSERTTERSSTCSLVGFLGVSTSAHL